VEINELAIYEWFREGMTGRSSAGTMTFWVIMLGNREVDVYFSTETMDVHEIHKKN
jgi:hypothetical protein